MDMELFDEMEQEIRANARRLSPTRNLIAGGVGGMFAWLTSHPFDTIKVRLQVMATSVQPGQSPAFTGAIDCLQKVVKEGGVRSLFRGVTSPLLTAMPSTAVLFYSLSLGKRLQLSDLGQEPTLLQYMNAGIFCGFTVTLLTCPAERVKCLVQTQITVEKTKRKGPWLILKNNYREEGIRGVYRGLFLHWALNMIGLGAWYLSYEGLLKSMRPRGSTRDDVTMTSIVLSGAISGVLLWFLIFPIDLLKTRYQVSPVGLYPLGGRDILREILKRDGVKGLYKGFAPALMRAPIFNIALLIGYELSLKTMIRIFPS